MGRPMPPSKHDRSLPYTYEAWIDALDGAGTEPVWHHYFCDTLCGLIEYLDEEEMAPDKVKLYGVFQQQQTRLDIDLLTDGSGGSHTVHDLWHGESAHEDRDDLEA